MNSTLRMVAALLVLVIPHAARAQNTFHYPAPAPGTITVVNDAHYGASGPVTLMMDVYRPAKAAGRVPALIFFNQSVGEQRRAFTFYVRWGQTAAMNGLVAIVPDLRSGSAAADFQILLAHMTSRAADYGIDPDAIAVYAGSGNVFTALPALHGESLLFDGQFAAACGEFEKLKGKGLGPRDLGLPAARACAQMGDGDRAVAWLQSIPSRFLPLDVQKDAALASVHGRADFQALFKR